MQSTAVGAQVPLPKWQTGMAAQARSRMAAGSAVLKCVQVRHGRQVAGVGLQVLHCGAHVAPAHWHNPAAEGSGVHF